MDGNMKPFLTVIKTHATPGIIQAPSVFLWLSMQSIYSLLMCLFLLFVPTRLLLCIPWPCTSCLVNILSGYWPYLFCLDAAWKCRSVILQARGRY